jgi:hypothetical protein
LSVTPRTPGANLLIAFYVDIINLNDFPFHSLALPGMPWLLAAGVRRAEKEILHSA